MPDVDGLTLLRQLRALPGPAVMAMLTTCDADEYILTALCSDAAGFPLKDTEPDELTRLGRTLHAGGVVMPPEESRRVTPAQRPSTPLAHTDDAVAPVARRLGFSGPSDLSKFCARRTGVARSDVRCVQQQSGDP